MAMVRVSTRLIEVGVGVFVALGMAALFMLAMQVSNLALSEGTDDGYRVVAYFDNVGGLKVRSPVTMAGVHVGRVRAIDFDDRTYQARVTMGISENYDKIPEDTMANIYTAGLLGEQYVALEPGGSDGYLNNGDEIKITQSALVLEQMIGQFLFNKGAAPPAAGPQGSAGGQGGGPPPNPFAP